MKPGEFIKKYVNDKAENMITGSARILDYKIEAITVLLDLLIDDDINLDDYFRGGEDE